MEYVSTCPICSSTQFTNTLKAKDYTTTGEIFQIVQCSACHLVLTNPQPKPDEIGKYYESNKYISHTDGSKNILDKIYLLARTFTLKWKLDLVQKYHRAGKILDFGCGTGEFLKYCKTNGWKISGVEPSDAARAKASTKTGENIHSSIDETPENGYDAITLWHVLEHLHQPDVQLKKIASRLKPDGTLYIAVPNYLSADGKKYHQYWAAYDVPRHLWHFSQNTMSILTQKVGLKIVRTVPMKLDAYYVSLLSEQYKSPQRTKVANVLSAFATGIRSNLAARKNNNYSSLIYIAKHA